MNRVVFLLSFISCPAMAEIKSGSIGVVYFTNDQISVAADSRAIHYDGGNPTNDACKIITLGNDLIFVSSGANEVDMNPGSSVSSWNNNQQAKAAYSKIIGSGSSARGHVGDIAKAWGDAISNSFDSVRRFYGADFSRLPVAADGTLTDALFAGLADDGALELFYVVVTASMLRLPVVQSNHIDVLRCPYGGFCPIGEPEIAIEFAGLNSDRAKQDAAEFNLGDSAFPGDYNWDVSRAIHMVELTEQYHVGNDVGGPVDAVQLRWWDGAERIHWYARKPNCQEH